MDAILNPDAQEPYKDLLVTVEEDHTGSLMFGLGVNSDAGLTANVVLNERNFDVSPAPWVTQQAGGIRGPIRSDGNPGVRGSVVRRPGERV